MSASPIPSDPEERAPGRGFPREEEGVYPLPPPRSEEERGPLHVLRRDPFLRLTIYYVVLVGVAALLSWLVPPVRQVFDPVYLPSAQGGAGLLEGGSAVPPSRVPGTLLDEVVSRSLTTFLVILGALILVVPVAWVYMQAKRLRFDPALVRSVIILPIVVAGIALVVKNSVALAFSLAGIVAAVRFRNTLKDPRDAVYIFLTIAIGLSAGVQALDVALVMSLVFNFVVLALWRFNVGSIYGGRFGRTGVLSAGDPGLFVAQAPEERNRVRRSMLDGAEGLEADGIVLIHATQSDLARHMVQEAFAELADDWRLVRVVPRGAELVTLEYLVELKKDTTPAEMVGALGERWSSQIVASEYVPFRIRQHDRPEVVPGGEE